MPEAASTPRAARRRHDDALKQRVLDECRQPGASVARVALSHGLNANLVHKWCRTIGRASGVASGMQPLRQELFVPVVVNTEREAGQPIKIELRRGALAVSLTWPVDQAEHCAAWLRELLR
jgi:transposase